MTSRVVISSVPNFVTILKRYPQLMNMPAFAGIVNVINQANNNGDTKCSPCKAKKIINSNRKVFEAALTSLQQNEKDQMKVVMQTKEICYYTVNAQNKLDIVCF